MRFRRSEGLHYSKLFCKCLEGCAFKGEFVMLGLIMLDSFVKDFEFVLIKDSSYGKQYTLRTKVLIESATVV